MNPIQRFDAIVVGGGLMGSSAALHLRKFHGMSVALLERGYVGAQASGVNFGHVRRQGRFLPQLPLAHRSRRIWGALPELVSHDCEFLPSGSLKLAFAEEEMDKLVSYAQEAKHWGLEIQVLGAAELRAEYPWLNPNVLGGTRVPDDGHANPRLVTPAFGRAAHALGVVVRESCEVLVIDHDPSGFRVQAADGQTYLAPRLLNTAGAWGNRIAGWFGEAAPLEIKGPLMAVTEPLPYFLAPALGSGNGPCYLRQVQRGNVIWGGGRWSQPQLDPPRAKADAEHLTKQFEDIVRLVPALRGAQVIRTWSGVEAYVADGIPVMGPSATTPGLFHAYGFCGHGFQLGPAVGAVAAEYLANGESETPIAPFSISRFSGAAAIVGELHEHED
ncbi:MAG: FAD-binding oxidoreductase [Comamonadaceae bacterium]|nr:FAD-binding oxidoreductase [Comamonadaceae bacterium]